MIETLSVCPGVVILDQNHRVPVCRQQRRTGWVVTFDVDPACPGRTHTDDQTTVRQGIETPFDLVETMIDLDVSAHFQQPAFQDDLVEVRRCEVRARPAACRYAPQQRAA